VQYRKTLDNLKVHMYISKYNSYFS